MLRRARLFFLAAVVVAGVVLATEVPIGDLVHARAAVADAAHVLAKVRSENRELSAQIHELKQGSTIQQIAHEQYGLIEPGQRSIVIMPGGGSTGSVRGHGSTGETAPLGQSTIPKSDLVPSDSQVAQVGAGQGGGGGRGFWQRVLQRLEFWKASA
ncbi:MAG: septum formation initiator family protein [Acidimicrobiales bacterium]